jgi:hypothetical protein
MLLNKLNNLSKITKDWDLVILFKLELLVFPGGLDDVQFCFNFGLFLGTIDQFCYLLCVPVESELEEVLKAEAWRLEVNLLACDSHQFLPMPLLHELGMQLRNQRQDGVHVLDSVIKSSEGLVVLDLFVLGALWIALLCLHVLDLCHEVVCVDLVPEGGFPGLELIVNQGNEIPHLLEVLKIVSAVLQGLVRGLLHVEEGLEVVECPCLTLQGHGPVIVLTNGSI